MSGAHRVRVAKIKVERDKHGHKLCTIELARTVDEADQDTPAVWRSIQHMQDNEKVTKLHLGIEMKACSLEFYGAPQTKPSESFAWTEAYNYRLKREKPGSFQSSISMSFDFTVSLEAAKRWLIPAIGDDILCVIGEPQMRLPEEPRTDGKEAAD